MKNKLTQEELKELLYYNPDTGIFTWKKDNKNNLLKSGSVAGCLLSNRHIQIKVKEKKYQAHRLAFLYMEGYFPENEVDHIDRNPSNNKWENLREASRSCNMRNCGIAKNNTSGITGISWDSTYKRWSVRIGTGKSIEYVGVFANKLDAAKARWDAEVKYGYPNCNTTSSAYLYLKEKNLI